MKLSLRSIINLFRRQEQPTPIQTIYLFSWQPIPTPMPVPQQVQVHTGQPQPQPQAQVQIVKLPRWLLQETSQRTSRIMTTPILEEYQQEELEEAQLPTPGEGNIPQDEVTPPTSEEDLQGELEKIQSSVMLMLEEEKSREIEAISTPIL